MSFNNAALQMQHLAQTAAKYSRQRFHDTSSPAATAAARCKRVSLICDLLAEETCHVSVELHTLML